MRLKRLFSVPGLALIAIAAIGTWAILRHYQHEANWQIAVGWLLCCLPFFYLLVKE